VLSYAGQFQGNRAIMHDHFGWLSVLRANGPGVGGAVRPGLKALRRWLGLLLDARVGDRFGEHDETPDQRR
jgi:hypothetical protein